MTTPSKMLQSTLVLAAAITMGIATAEAGGLVHPSPGSVAPVRTTLQPPVWPKPIPGHTGTGDVQKGGTYTAGGGGILSTPCRYDISLCRAGGED